MYMAVTAMHALRTGTEFHVRLFTTMSKDLAVLGVADLALVAFTFTAYLHQRLVMAGWLKSPLDVVMQHLQQAALFALAALFIYGRDWPWIQSGTLMMHAITLFMKMHSYTVTNRELAEVRPHGMMGPARTAAAVSVLTLSSVHCHEAPR